MENHGLKNELRCYTNFDELTENMEFFLGSQLGQMIFNKRFGIDLFPFVLEIVISPQFFQDTENL